jgi:hypothetical protein
MNPKRLTLLLVLITMMLVSCQSGEVAPTQEAQSVPETFVTATPTSMTRPTPTKSPETDEEQASPEPTTPPATATPAPAAEEAEPSAPEITYAVQTVNRGAGFAVYEPIAISVQPAVPPYSTALTDLTNPNAVTFLSPAQQAALEERGFVITPANFAQIYQVYKQANDRGQPIFVTTDAMLHTYHVLYDFALRDAEISHFVGDLQALTAEMLAQSQLQMAGASGDARQAALRNLAYFSVAASLLDPAFAPLPEVADLVSAELTLIEAHSGFQRSPIFGYREDYSQYVPRGHYTRNETFERYFRAMMWYGRIGFRLRPGNTAELLAMGRMETRQAILIAVTLNQATVQGESALSVWERIYEPTVFFVGSADDLTIYDYLPLIQSIYGQTFNPQSLNDEAKLETFIQQAAELRPPKIVGGYVTDQEDPAVVTQGFRFMGQRFVPDAYIFQQLVYDKVGTQSNPRVMPSGLDVTSVLGSERAFEIQREIYSQDQYTNYTTQIEKLQAEFAALPAAQWTENLYWGWLYSLQPLLTPAGEGYPIFMQHPAWVDKDLHTFLGSWSELKHDTILYAKQSTTLKATSLEPQRKLANGYVEPRPEVFARLAALVSQTRRGLEGRDLLNNEFKSKFATLEDILWNLQVMAEKELTNRPLSADEQAQIRNVGQMLEGLTTFSGQTTEALASGADERLAIVADVHTDPNTNQVLEEAVGDAYLIWVIAPVDGQPALTMGAVFSYYEFTWPLSDRLTDEAWQALSPKPDQPVWTTSFIAPR